MKQNKARVAVIMGSESDLDVMSSACDILEQFKIPYLVQIVSAHRTPKLMMDFAGQAREAGLEVIIAGAGGAAHLPGMVAALTTLPVIGVPVSTTALQGVDALLSIAQMPRGVPVATVAIGNATNAALLAVQILASRPEERALQKELATYRETQTKKVLQSAKSLFKRKNKHKAQ